MGSQPLPLCVPVEEAAYLLGISKHTVRAYIRRGAIQTIQIGRRRLVPRTECERVAREGISGDTHKPAAIAQGQEQTQ